MDQYQSSGSGSGSGSGSNANTNTSNKADEWLQLSSLMLEGLSEEQLELDDLDDLAGLRGFSGASTETANSNSAGAQNTISNNNAANNINNINHVGDMTVSQMAIATQQAILASSLLANQSFLAALGNPMNPMMAATPMMPMLAQPYYPSPLPPILPPPVPSSSSASAQPRTASSTGPKPASEKTESELDKRRRNTAASARFRAKKKEKQQMMEQTTKQLSDKVSLLERRLQEYEMEIQMLRQEIDQKDGADNNKKRLRDLYEEVCVSLYFVGMKIWDLKEECEDLASTTPLSFPPVKLKKLKLKNRTDFNSTKESLLQVKELNQRCLVVSVAVEGLVGLMMETSRMESRQSPSQISWDLICQVIYGVQESLQTVLFHCQV
ncbi:hypothetical protein BCR33DRAFT_503664 [Rhizoclosmatium globosum]|uniref:BZIP domain-containing protein n=1 Tax=Rhizoclosmatium globosum TaxID=329046 RepID=A0A1Y2BK35_9FUNG|nr:hypothetical protein BCR33DRAFT_503664 [Rhizoclosmatium globosum]|eukprot:ORY35142.1 hypothetical protein BCR33DRAFT_503664 [Rhizoclosmatium globosum]